MKVTKLQRERDTLFNKMCEYCKFVRSYNDIFYKISNNGLVLLTTDPNKLIYKIFENDDLFYSRKTHFKAMLKLLYVEEIEDCCRECFVPYSSDESFCNNCSKNKLPPYHVDIEDTDTIECNICFDEFHIVMNCPNSHCNKDFCSGCFDKLFVTEVIENGILYKFHQDNCKDLWKCPYCTVLDDFCLTPYDCTSCNKWFKTMEEFVDCSKCGCCVCVDCLIDIGGVLKCRNCIDHTLGDLSIIEFKLMLGFNN